MEGNVNIKNQNFGLEVVKNRHPIDRLADVRAEIKRLDAVEAELRKSIIVGDFGLTGDQYIAEVRETTRETIDSALVRKHLGPDGIKPFLKKSTTQTVRLTERVLSDE